MIVFETVTLSVLPLRSPPPLINAIKRSRKTAPPTIQTQGSVYQVRSVEVVVVVDTEELVDAASSCAHASAENNVRETNKNSCLKFKINRFIVLIFNE